MNKETIEQYRKIVDDAPEGENTVLSINGVGDKYTFQQHNPYSLDNLRAIIALWDENQELKTFVKKLTRTDISIANWIHEKAKGLIHD